MNTKDRLRGMLIGHSLGDATGAPYELYLGQSLEYTPVITHRTQICVPYQGTKTLALGQCTDDTEMSLALLRSLVENGRYERDRVVEAYMEWANSGTCMIGKNTKGLFKGVKTLRGYETRYQKQFTNEPLSSYTLSNGSLMRAAPLAVLPFSLTQDATTIDCMLSNPHPINQEASRIYVSALRLALEGRSRDEIWNYLKDRPQLKEVKEVFNQVDGRIHRDMTQNKGYVLHGLYCAIWCLCYMNSFDNIGSSASEFPKGGTQTHPFEEAMDWVIRDHRGSDTDTNAAITGALMGALLGYDALTRELAIATNIKLIRECDTSTGAIPRPSKYTLGDFDSLCDRVCDTFLL